MTLRAASAIASFWAFPFAAGPIIGSRDAYAYVAQGELAQRGLDPAKAVVTQLGGGPLLAAVDPRWRDTRPPYGGVAVAIEKWAAAPDGRPGLALLVLRLVAVVAVITLVVLTARMAPTAFRPAVVIAVGANPIVLIHLIGAAHLDAVAAALLVAGLWVARVPEGAASRALVRQVAGVALATLGAMVKLPVALGAIYLAIGGVLAAGPALGARLRVLALDLIAALAAIGFSMGISGSGLAWVQNFGTPGRLRTGIAPADMLAHVVRAVAWVFGLHPDSSEVLRGARVAAALAGGVIALALLLPRPTLNRLAFALLALCLLGPVLYPWYLAPALPLLALAASRPPAAAGPARGVMARRAWFVLVGLSIVLTLAALPRLAPAWGYLGDHPIVTGMAAIAVASLAFVVPGRCKRAASRMRESLRSERTIMGVPAEHLRHRAGQP